MIVLIYVSLSHLFFFLLHLFLFRRLGVNILAHAHPLCECSKYRKGVDQFDLYLASGLGKSPHKIPKETKCETLVDTVLNIKKAYGNLPESLGLGRARGAPGLLVAP